MNKNVIFFIQGEGRGHLTQSLALKDKFKKAGINVIAVIIGKSPERALPEFFTSKIDAEIIEVESPNFVMDKDKKGIDLFRTGTVNIQKIGIFKKSIKTIKECLERYKPDFLINFYEPLLGFLNSRGKINYPTFSIAHQFIFNHSDYEFPKASSMDKYAVKSFTKLAGAKSINKFALSLYPLADQKEIIVIPPILRKEVFQFEPKQEGFLLIYLLNQGYLPEVQKFHSTHPDEIIHVFTDKKGIVDGEELAPNLFLHPLNDIKFLEKMSECNGMLCTAGFESIAEAMYYGKPCLMIPVKGHFEQFCNSRDASNAGAGTYGDEFNLQKLNDFIPKYMDTSQKFKEWLNSGEDKLINTIKSYFKN